MLKDIEGRGEGQTRGGVIANVLRAARDASGNEVTLEDPVEKFEAVDRKVVFNELTIPGHLGINLG